MQLDFALAGQEPTGGPTRFEFFARLQRSQRSRIAFLNHFAHAQSQMNDPVVRLGSDRSSKCAARLGELIGVERERAMNEIRGRAARIIFDQLARKAQRRSVVAGVRRDWRLS